MIGITREQQQNILRHRSEERYITVIYMALIGIIVASPFLEAYTSSTIVRSIELMCTIIAFLGILIVRRKKMLVGFKGWRKFLVFLLVISCIQIIWRNEWSEREELKDILLLVISSVSTLPYLLPFFVLFLPNERHTDRICNIFFYASLLTLPLWAMNASNLVQDDYLGESIGAWLPLFCCFALVYPNNLSKFKKFIMWGIWAVYLVLMLLNARRQMSFTLIFYALLWFYELIIRLVRNKFLRIVVYSVILSLATINVLIDIQKYSDGPFNRFSERLSEDTRSNVELFFWADYLSSTPEEQAFGKGGTGTYYQEMIDPITGEMTTDRPEIETGYLMMLLKGGYVHVAIIVLLMLTAIIRSSRSKLPDAVALFWLFILFIVCNYSSPLICTYYSHSIVFWLCISLALHERNIPNTQRKIA